MNAKKTIDLVVLLFLGALSGWLSILFDLTFFPSTLLFLGVPSLYLAIRLRTRTQWQRIAAMGIVFGLWYGYLFAYLADWNRAWAWPDASLPWGWFLGVNPAEWAWVFLWILFIVLFYEHFIERDRREDISYRIVWAIVPAVFVSIVVYVFTHYYPAALNWSYAYAVLALLTLPPALVLLAKNPRIYLKISLPALFFIPLHLAHEVTGLALNHWYFPGQYFWVVPLPNSTGVPIEEFIIWIVLGSILVLSYYELYIDDGY